MQPAAVAAATTNPMRSVPPFEKRTRALARNCYRHPLLFEPKNI